MKVGFIVLNVVSLAREENAQIFENVDISVTKLWKFVINTLYTLISAHHSLLVSSFAHFLNFCCSFSSD
jgi:hypothetical protein